MGKLIESTHVSLGGQIDELDDWAFPYLDEEHNRYAAALLEEADVLSDSIVILDAGRVIASGTADELKRRMGHSYCQVTPLHPEDLVRVASVLGGYEGAEVDAAANTVSVPAPHGVTTLGEVFRKLEELGVELMDISLRKPSLDEVFLHLTGPTLTV